jgi:exodeoxyribonuclease V alpha subunit
MLAAGVPSFELREIRRNAGDIVRACHDIKDGKTPDYPTDSINLNAGHNWRHIPAKADRIPFIIEQLLSEKLPQRGFDALWDVQIISPTNDRGAQSCKALNAVAKGVLNPSQDAKGLPISVRDKVVRLKNGQATGVNLDDKGRVTSHSDAIRIVNGDIGVAEDIDDKHIIVRFLYPNRRVQLPRKEHHLRRAFCMTCHKMQGSEVPVVILPLTRAVAAPPMVTREWLYTAMSRAKLMLITVGDKGVLPQIIARIGMNNRCTTLRDRIQSALAAPAKTINARKQK